MSAVAITPLHRAVRFWDAPVGSRVVMAGTDLVLFGYVVGHLLGNLRIYASNPEQINAYARFLHSPANVGLLWAVRLLLLVAVGMHIVAAVQLWKLSRD